MKRIVPAWVSAPAIRASHADRDRVVDVLRVAAGDGYLTAGELDERLEIALTARTRGELAALTVDLPVTPMAAAWGGKAKEVLKIEQKHGSPVLRSGRWVLPHRIEVKVKWANVTLDLTEAVITRDTLDVVVAMTGGDLTLVTRPGVLVDLDDLRLTHCQVKQRETPVSADIPLVLRVRVKGAKKHGRIAVGPARPPFGQRFKRRTS